MRLTRRGKVVTFFLVLGVIALGGLAAASIYLRSVGVYGGSNPGEKVTVEIPKGASATEVGRLLERTGIIDSAMGLRIKLFLDDRDINIQAGRYEIPTGLNIEDALAVLAEGPLVEFVTVTFPEGIWLTDFARILARETHIPQKQFLKLVQNARIPSTYLPEGVDTLEGLLYPSTYQVIERDTARTVAQRLVGEFEKQADGLDFSGAEALGVTPYQAIIIASMIEAEAKVDDERAMVARVIYNRLERRMALGIDATVNYAIQDHKLGLTRSDLEVDSPYNTRRFPGLPPTPIGASGAAALEAALYPADGDWLYYVLKDCEGNHAFSESYQEFLQNKSRYEALGCDQT
jgi:UPF0755 protein